MEAADHFGLVHVRLNIYQLGENAKAVTIIEIMTI
jgi:hypothetical protein